MLNDVAIKKNDRLIICYLPQFRSIQNIRECRPLSKNIKTFFKIIMNTGTSDRRQTRTLKMYNVYSTDQYCRKKERKMPDTLSRLRNSGESS